MSVENAATICVLPAKDSADGPRIAIIGCGPKGLYCLESLCREYQQRAPSERSHIFIFEPAEYCGAGTVYDPAQPSYLRMNFAAKYINAWSPTDSSADEANDEQSLAEWLAVKNNRRSEPDAFVPRATVGEYLRDCFRIVMERVREFADITIHQCHVNSVVPQGSEWRLETSENTVVHAEEVVITVGHEGWRQSTVRASEDRNDLDMIPVFPTTGNLHSHKISAGSTVAVRGFGLSWIDAVLALTEGRGGRFVGQMGELRYIRSGSEPRKILPFSRTGRPMLAKPIEGKLHISADLSEIWKTGQRAVSDLERPITREAIWGQLWCVIRRTAEESLATALAAVTGSRSDKHVIDEFFDRWRNTTWNGPTAIGVMRDSWNVATGRIPVDAGWALGETWRKLYPAIVAMVSHSGLAADAWEPFLELAAEMERIAFGPPAENLERILALEDFGLVDLEYLRADIGRNDGKWCLQTDDDESKICHAVNAVIPSATAIAEEGPLRSLLNQGVIRRLHQTTAATPNCKANAQHVTRGRISAGGQRLQNGRPSLGIEVTREGQPIAARATDVSGLAILGRATEGCILGNDTLSRTLHNHPQLWAAAVVRRCCPDSY